MKNKKYNVPKVIIDEKERKLLDTLTKRYQKLITPGPIKKTIYKVSSKTNEIIPTSVKDLGEKVKGKINEQELIQKSLEILGSNFQKIQEFAAKYTVSEALIYQSVNKISKENIIENNSKKNSNKKIKEKQNSSNSNKQENKKTASDKQSQKNEKVNKTKNKKVNINNKDKEKNPKKDHKNKVQEDDKDNRYTDQNRESTRQ